MTTTMIPKPWLSVSAALLASCLAAHGATADDLPLYAGEAHANRRLMDNNPIDMSVEDVLAIYKAAF